MTIASSPKYQILIRPQVTEWIEWLQRHPIGAGLIAFSAGSSLVIAFAPFGWWPLGSIALAVLVFLWLGGSARQLFWRGYLFGLGFFGLGVSWVFNSIYEFGHAPIALAMLITLTFILYLSLYPALAGLIAHRFCHLPLWVRLILIYPSIWTLLEWFRSWLWTGFPWLLLGQAQLDTPLAGIIPLFGVLGASAISMLIAGLLVLGAVASGTARLGSVFSIIMVVGFCYVLMQVKWTGPSGSAIRVSLIQANIPQDMKWQTEQFQSTLDLYRDLTRTHWESDLIIWPETAVPAFYHQIEKSYFNPLVKEAQLMGSELLIGTFFYDPDQNRTYNSMVKLGQQPEFYHKRHLVPFGEYLPLRGLLSWVGDMIVIPMSDLSSGRELPLIQLQNFSVGISICYEDAYGNEVIDALPQAALLVNVSNDAWFGDSLAPHQHLEIARLRALETGRYLLRSTNTGISAAIDPKGAVIARSPQFETDVLSVEIFPQQGLTPFARWGNWGVVMLVSGLLIIIVCIDQVFTRRQLRSLDRKNSESTIL
jgi:apolipoprotein N-acyltransferase